MTTPFEAVKALDDALERGDLEAALNFYEDDAVLVVTPEQIARGKQEIREFFISLLKLSPRVHQLKTHVIESGDIALFLSQWSFSGSDETGQPFSREAIATCVLRKNASGNWRLVIDNALGPNVLSQKINDSA
jgi:uncharacterized protein (TIGR02246 family)